MNRTSPSRRRWTGCRASIPWASGTTTSRTVAASPSTSDRVPKVYAYSIPKPGCPHNPARRDGTTWKTAVQLRLRPSGLAGTSAELGASIVRENAVADHFVLGNYRSWPLRRMPGTATSAPTGPITTGPTPRPLRPRSRRSRCFNPARSRCHGMENSLRPGRSLKTSPKCSVRLSTSRWRQSSAEVLRRRVRC